MNMLWKTPAETFVLNLCSEEPSDAHPEGRLVVELLDADDKLVSLVDFATGQDTSAESERAIVEPTLGQIAEIKTWTSGGCAIVAV